MQDKSCQSMKGCGYQKIIKVICDRSGSKIFDPAQVRSIFCGLGQVGSGQPSMVWVWVAKISPKNINFFNFFSLRSKKNLFRSSQKVPGSKAGRLLIYCGSKVSSHLVGSGPISTKNLSLHHSDFLSNSEIWIMLILISWKIHLFLQQYY